MSELELSLFRQRSQEALKQKARRGALFLGVAAGYVKTGRDRIEKDPDQRVQDALRLVFAKFAELQSVRQVHVWLRDEGIALPVACHSAAEGRSIVWRLPLYNTVHNILTNPVYAGAYAFGRTTSKVSVEDGRKRVQARTAAPTGGMGRAAQGSARGLHHLERVREEPAGDCRQCDRQRQRHGQRSGAARGVASRRASALWPLRPQDVCGLWRQGGALSLPGRAREPRHRAVHLVRRLARRSCRRHGGSAGLEAARHRCRGQGARGSDERDVSRPAATRAGAAAGALRGRPCASAI